MKYFDKICSVCKTPFRSCYQNKKICSFDCKMQAARERSLYLSKRKNLARKMKYRVLYEPCEICGFDLITEMHHEEDGIHFLCLNHHALITRNFTTFEIMKKHPYYFTGFVPPRKNK